MKKYSVKLGERTITFRELNLGEWGDLRGLKSGNISFYASVVERAIIDPTYFDLRPGEILYLGEKIFQISSRFADDKAIEDGVAKIRDGFEDSVHIIPALICSTFQAYTPEMVLEFDFDTLVIRLAQVQYLNEMNTPKPVPQGANELEARSIDNSQGALQKALRDAKREGVSNV